MEALQEQDIIRFLRENIKPLENAVYGNSYRASVYLTDGTYLPCVIFRNPDIYVALALRRFKEEKGSFFKKSKSGFGYDKIVKHFVTTGNQISYYDIAKVEASPFAFPIDILKELRGETTMGWTGFVLKMNDGKFFGFGTRFTAEFFDMPQGYNPSDITEVISHSYINASGEVKSHREGFSRHPEGYNVENIFREKPYFQCYIGSL
jgi:hypothetical protein